MKDYQDVLGHDDVSFVILSKGNRLQIVHKPSKKDLIRRGRRGWRLNAYCLNSQVQEERQTLETCLKANMDKWFGEAKPEPVISKPRKRVRELLTGEINKGEQNKSDARPVAPKGSSE
jgi:hypothetical protein